ncbi:MAG: MOSC domain-containing protein [Dehalococcoidia bacterium]|nr:MOSC domain-containing protein [Dehalococcoidia bacterium]
MEHTPTLLSLNTGRPAALVLPHGLTRSAIVKAPVAGPLELTANGLESDEQADRRVHGGPDKAVCVYPFDHYRYWRDRLGRELEPGAFGENFTTSGLLETEVCIGDTYGVGDAVVQVSQPRSPCYRLAANHNRPDMVKWVVSTGYTGFYLRTLRPGTVEPGDRITLLSRSTPSVTVARTNAVTYAARPSEADVTAVLESPGLASTWREALEDRLRRLSRASQ